MAEEPDNIVAAVAEVSEHLSVLVREEIELAKAEVTAKAMKLLRGAIVGIVAGVFLLFAAIIGLEGIAWLLWWALPTGHAFNAFYGFFLMAGILVIFAAIAGAIAFKAVRAGTPPTPRMAVEEARQIRATIGSPTDS